jgi:chemotaxis protein MotB
MSKKKKHPEHVNHERWLVSYADFITLLFAFFVVLFASGQNDKRKTLKLAQAMQSAFQYNGIFDQHAKTPPLSDDPATAPAAVPSPLMLPVPSAIEQEKVITAQIKAKVEARIEDLVHHQVALKQVGATSINVHDSDAGLVISLREAGFFDSGSAEVRPEALPVLKAIAATLPHQPMRIEGHTDNVPIHTAQFATNWELSTARAADITRMLIAEAAVEPSQISATGYAEFHPVADNKTDLGRQQNRRVDIILLNPAKVSAPAAATQEPAIAAATPPPQVPSR